VVRKVVEEIGPDLISIIFLVFV